MGDHQMVDERFLYTELLERIRPGEQCLDIGGHIGTLTAAMLEAAPGVQVVAVEPDPESVAVFRANMEWRGLHKNATLLAGALREHVDATSILYRDPLNMSVNSCVPIRGRESVNVTTVTVADVLQACTSVPTVAKVDIEGGEFEVLPMLLAACPQLRLLALELHLNKRIFRAHLAPALLQLLHLLGFQPLRGRRVRLDM